MKAIKSIEIEVPGDLQALGLLLHEFNKIYQDYIPFRDWLECRLALAEGFTNAVRHAHKNFSSEVTILVEVILNNTAIKIKIWDYGSGFDLKTFIIETAKKNENWLNSGRGIPILNKICDRLDYYRLGEKNCLSIVKKFSNSESENNSKS